MSSDSFDPDRLLNATITEAEYDMADYFDDACKIYSSETGFGAEAC